MNRSVALLVCCALAPAVEPLSEAGELADAVRQALHQFAQGRPEGVAELPSVAWTSPPAIADPREPGLAWRWTELMPSAADRAGRVPPWPSPANAVEAWDRGGGAALLVQAAERCLDRGALASAWLLARRGGATPLPRLRDLDEAEPLTSGGARRVSSVVPSADPSALVAVRGWLLATDPWGRIRWQRRLDVGTRTVTGWRSAAISGPAGALVVDEDGRARGLPPVPAGVVPRACGTAGAWFATATGRTWWFVRPDHPVESVELEEEPLGQPLVRGPWTLFLGETAVHLHDGQGRHRRSVPHGLLLGRGAVMVGSPDHPAVRDAQGGVWRLDGPSVAAAVASAASSERGASWPGQPGESQAPVEDPSQRLPDGRWRAGGWTVALTMVDGRLHLAAQHDRGEWWRTSWLAPPLLDAPGRTLAVSGDLVVVQEGQDRFTALALENGAVRLARPLSGADPSTLAVSGTGLAAWSTAVGIAWQDPVGGYGVLPLGPGWRAVGRAADMLVLGPGGWSPWVPGLTPVPQPAPWGVEDLVVDCGGVRAGGRWHPWRP